MARFTAWVPLRWTDQDAYLHLNNGAIVTLLEEARIALLFDEAGAAEVADLASGLLVVALHVDYRRQVPYRSRPVPVAMWVDEVRAASFRIGYELRAGPDEPVAVAAWTRMATYDLAAQRLRGLLPEERVFLGKWSDDRPDRRGPGRC